MLCMIFLQILKLQNVRECVENGKAPEIVIDENKKKEPMKIHKKTSRSGNNSKETA